MTLEVVVVESEATLDHVVALEADLVNALEVVLKIDILEAGLKASHMTIQDVIPSHQLGVIQDHHPQEINTTTHLV